MGVQLWAKTSDKTIYKTFQQKLIMSLIKSQSFTNVITIYFEWDQVSVTLPNFMANLSVG